jgi:hypothetical protein
LGNTICRLAAILIGPCGSDISSGFNFCICCSPAELVSLRRTLDVGWRKGRDAASICGTRLAYLLPQTSSVGIYR